MRFLTICSAVCLFSFFVFSPKLTFAGDFPDKGCSCSPNAACPSGGSVTVSACTDNKGGFLRYEGCGYVGCSCEITKPCADRGGGGGGGDSCTGTEGDSGSCVAHGGNWKSTGGETVTGCYAWAAHSCDSSWGWCRHYGTEGKCNNDSQCGWTEKPVSCSSGTCDCTKPPPPPPPKHKACRNNACVQVDGQGSDSCKNNSECAPPPPALSCQIKIKGINDGISRVKPGESKRLEAIYKNGVAPVKFLWTVNSTSGSNGFISNPNTDAVVMWTPPENLSAAQDWTITLRVMDSRKGVNFCTKGMKFTPGPVINTDAFFQTFNGDVTAKRELTDSGLPEGKAMSGSASHPQGDAGLVLGSRATLTKDGSKFSENGVNEGFNLSPYVSAANLPTYESLLKKFLLNSGYGSLAKIPACPDADFDSPPFHIWCYGSDLDSRIDAAVKFRDDPDIKYHVFVPNPKGSLGSKSISTDFTGRNAINKNMLVFVNGDQVNNLKVTSDVEIKQVADKFAFMVIVNGGVRVNSTVKKLDGFYVFSGLFNDGSSDTKIEATGSLIGTSENSFDFPDGLLRQYVNSNNPAPSETWTYDGKYLALFQNVIGRPKFGWKELPGN